LKAGEFVDKGYNRHFEKSDDGPLKKRKRKTQETTSANQEIQ